MKENEFFPITENSQTPSQAADVPSENTAAQDNERAAAFFFQEIAFPTILYAIFYTFCLYRNLSGITMPLFCAATAAYCFYCMNRLGVRRKKDTLFYIFMMLLLGISDVFTGSPVLIFCNNIGIFFLLVCMLLHNYCSDEHWTPFNYLVSVFFAASGALLSMLDPFLDAICYYRKKKDSARSRLTYILIGLVAAFPLLFIITGLLFSADAVFADMIRLIGAHLFHGKILFEIFAVFLFACLSSYCGLRYLGKHQLCQSHTQKVLWEPAIAVTILSLLSIVYIIFCFIQIICLFGGNAKLPDGTTYAAYAREGFFQLLFVSVINVGIVLSAQTFFRRSPAINFFLIILSLCTYIILASGAFRMMLYIRSYHLTLLRLLVLWAMAVIAVLLAGIIFRIIRPSFRLFRYGLYAVCIMYLILSFSHPDYIIASYNLAQPQKNCTAPDYDYLKKLSSDAAPVIAQQKGVWVKEYLTSVSKDYEPSLRCFNVSRYTAEKFRQKLG